MWYPFSQLELIINCIFIGIPIYYLSVYVFCKSQNIILRGVQVFYVLVTGIIFTALFVAVRIYNTTLSHFMIFFLIPVLLSPITRNSDTILKRIIIGLVSVSFVSIIEVVSILIQGVLFWMLNWVSASVYSLIPSKIISLILCVVFLNVKRFKRGIQFFQEEKNLGIGLALAEIVMILKCLNLREGQGKVYLYIIFVIGIIIAGFGLYLWIRRSITAHYRERLQLKSEEHYKELLEEKEQEIERLNQTNEYLAKIVHRDNHLMNSLNACFDSDNSGELLQEMQTMVQERSELINREQRESKLLPSTGNLLIDNTISELFIKATAHGIDFDLTVSKPVDEIIGKYISQTDLQTLLSDHIKDAIIAVESRGEGGGKILIDLSMQNDNYCITIYDSGVEFEIATLERLGIERVTTHADSGGSGIGFMTTFETLKKAYASLMITEFETKTPFTKSVSFRFDGESSFIIQSYRSNELKENLTREDVVIL